MTFCTVTVDGTSWAIALSTAVALDARTESGRPRPPSVTESTRTATRPSLAYGVPVITKSVVPKKKRAVAVSRTLLVVVRTTGSRTVTPLTVWGNEDAAALVSSASVTVNVKVDDEAVGDADGRAETDGDGVAVGVWLADRDGKTTRDGVQSRTSKTSATITSAGSASRVIDPTL